MITSRSEQRTQEEFVPIVHLTVIIHIYPPTTPQVTYIAWSEFCFNPFYLAEAAEITFLWQWVNHNNGVIIQSL